jgi:hemerythrin-like domain-containing protein
MKRSDALVSLSRDHHAALAIAQKLRRADDGEEAAALFAAYWSERGAAHFRIEEDVLLPMWARLGTLDGEAAARVSREHLAIRTAAIELAERRDVDLAHGLGRLLHDHVRFEERELFGLIEADLEATELERLARAVAEAEAKVHPPPGP